MLTWIWDGVEGIFKQLTMVSHHEERVCHPLGLSGVATVDTCRNYNHSFCFIIFEQRFFSFNAQFQAFKKLQNSFRKKYCESFEKCKKPDNSYGCLYNLQFLSS